MRIDVFEAASALGQNAQDTDSLYVLVASLVLAAIAFVILLRARL